MAGWMTGGTYRNSINAPLVTFHSRIIAPRNFSELVSPGDAETFVLFLSFLFVWWTEEHPSLLQKGLEIVV